MQLWETEGGDQWLCAGCREEQSQRISTEEWSLVLEQRDPARRCVFCGRGDVDGDD